MSTFEFRHIHENEIEQAIAIEKICFPPHEACSPQMMRERICQVPELFFVAIDESTGNIAGFINGISTNRTLFSDDFFVNAGLYEPSGENLMILGLDVLPAFRGQGLAREIVSRYAQRERLKGRKRLVLTCLEPLVTMYEKMGFVNLGLSQSTWGKEQWYEMEQCL